MEPEKSSQARIFEIDGANLAVHQLHQRIAELEEGSSVTLRGFSENLPGVGSGIGCSIDLRVEGSLGPFASMLGQKLRLEIAHDVSVGCGHSLHSGSILVRGESGAYLACYAVGGLVTAYGKVGDYAAYGLSGGDVVLRGRCGVAAGAEMNSGTLVIGNGAGDGLGHRMSGGTIFVRGTIGRLGEGVTEVALKESDSLRLGLLLARAGLKTQLTEFKAFRSTRSLKGAKSP